MIAQCNKPPVFRPRLVLAYADSAHAAMTCRHLRRLGWEVRLAGSGPEARRLVRLLRPDVVVLDTDLREESGWLTCAKMNMEFPDQLVVLVTAAVTAQEQEYARFVGAAAIVSRSVSVDELLEEVQQVAA
jgi:CheY-like chemotaxis protein